MEKKIVCKKIIDKINELQRMLERYYALVLPRELVEIGEYARLSAEEIEKIYFIIPDKCIELMRQENL